YFFAASLTILRAPPLPARPVRPLRSAYARKYLAQFCPASRLTIQKMPPPPPGGRDAHATAPQAARGAALAGGLSRPPTLSPPALPAIPPHRQLAASKLAAAFPAISCGRAGAHPASRLQSIQTRSAAPAASKCEPPASWSGAGPPARP